MHDYAVTLGKSLYIEPDMPRIVGRQIHHLITTYEICLPFLDYLMERLNTRFDKYG